LQSCYERYWKDKEGRTKLGDQLEELEITERVLARFGGRAVTTEKRMGSRPARIAPAAVRSAAPEAASKHLRCG